MKLTPIEAAVQAVRNADLTLCADFDEDCAEVKTPYNCWLHELGTGVCPYLCTKENQG